MWRGGRYGHTALSKGGEGVVWAEPKKDGAVKKEKASKERGAPGKWARMGGKRAWQGRESVCEGGL